MKTTPRAYIRRLYWVHFEGKVDERGRPHDYSSDPVIQVAGKAFHTDFQFYPTSGFAGPRGSDGDQARELLEKKGYSLGSGLARVRLVWLLGEPALDELMIIYLEDLERHGPTVTGLEADADAWNALTDGLRERALAGMAVIAQER